MKNFLIIFSLVIFSFPSFVSAAEKKEKQPVIVLGSGIGGLTSALYLARAGFSPIVITGPIFGGAITEAPHMENWPGENRISGIDLIEKLKKQVEASGGILRFETVSSIDFSKRPYRITTAPLFGADPSLTHYEVDACIISMGAKPNLLGVPGEKTYLSKGVYSCAICDGSLYKNKVVAVVGGGDSALLEAQYLSLIASKVHLIVRKNFFRTVEKKRMEKILSDPKIEVHYETVIEEIKGDQTLLTHLVLKRAHQDKSQPLFVDALFLAIGASPNTKLFEGQLELDQKQYIVLKNIQETSKPLIYAVGDIADPEFKQAISAAGDGAKAAIQAQAALSLLMTSQEITQERPLMEITASKKEVIAISSLAQLEQEISQATGSIFVDFYADYCGPCRMFAPIYRSWAEQYADKATFLKVDATVCPELCMKFDVRVLPTLVVLDKEGRVIEKLHGLNEISRVEQQRLKVLEPPIVR